MLNSVKSTVLTRKINKLVSSGDVDELINKFCDAMHKVCSKVVPEYIEMCRGTYIDVLDAMRSDKSATKDIVEAVSNLVVAIDNHKDMFQQIGSSWMKRNGKFSKTVERAVEMSQKDMELAQKIVEKIQTNW